MSSSIDLGIEYKDLKFFEKYRLGFLLEIETPSPYKTLKQWFFNYKFTNPTTYGRFKVYWPHGEITLVGITLGVGFIIIKGDRI